MSVPTVSLNDGNEIPAIAFGTGSKFRWKDVTEIVEQALEAGFSHIDSAAMYENEQNVGTAIRESGLAREDIWITTKYNGGGDVLEAARTSLGKLGLKHVDLYLIHGPWAIEHDDVEGVWDEMVRVREAGLSKSIGVSNFTLEMLQRVVKMGNVIPAVNQIRLHPYTYASWRDVLEYCAKHGIVTEAYGSLAPITTFPGGPLDPVLATIARRIGGTPGQVIFKWAHAKGFVVVTTTARRTRLDEYLGVVHLPDLTPEEMEAIDKAGAMGPPEPTRSLALLVLSCTHQARVRAAFGLLVMLFIVVFWHRVGLFAMMPCAH